MRQLGANGISFVQPSAAGAGSWLRFGGFVRAQESEYVLEARARAQVLRNSGGGSSSACAGDSDSDGYFDANDWAAADAALCQQQAAAGADRIEHGLEDVDCGLQAAAAGAVNQLPAPAAAGYEPQCTPYTDRPEPEPDTSQVLRYREEGLVVPWLTRSTQFFSVI